MSHVILAPVRIPRLKSNFSKDDDAGQFPVHRIQKTEKVLDLAIGY